MNISLFYINNINSINSINNSSDSNNNIDNNSSSNNDIINKNIGTVKVFFDSTIWCSNMKWPTGIILTHNINNNVQHISSSSSSSSSSYGKSRSINSKSLINISKEKNLKQKRIFTWKGDDLFISYNNTILLGDNYITTRIKPPLKWFKSSGTIIDSIVQINDNVVSSQSLISSIHCNVKRSVILSQEDIESDGSLIELVLPRKKAENALSTLRSVGFNREDIYRMLDKGPWVLAFDIAKFVPSLFVALQSDLGLTQAQAVHVTSHCPFLIAQYARYKGRDVLATASALLDAGYEYQPLVSNILRFPTILATPPDRIKGWVALLHAFGIALKPNQFVKMIERAPFMYSLNAPPMCDQELNNLSSFASEDDPKNELSHTIERQILVSLEILRDLQLPDIDKVVRSIPEILLVPANDISERSRYLFNLFREEVSYTSKEQSDALSKENLVDNDNEKNNHNEGSIFAGDDLNDIFTSLKSAEVNSISSEHSVSITSPEKEILKKAHDMLGKVTESYPHVLLLDVGRMKSMASALRACGLRRSEVVKLIKIWPQVLGYDPDCIKDIISILKFQVGLKKAELAPFLSQNPKILSGSVDDYQNKIDYLLHTLQGNPAEIRKRPEFLILSLSSYIRPRVEFLRAFGISIESISLSFITTATTSAIASAANVKVEAFDKFCYALKEIEKEIELQPRAQKPKPKLTKNSFNDFMNEGSSSSF